MWAHVSPGNRPSFIGKLIQLDVLEDLYLSDYKRYSHLLDTRISPEEYIPGLRMDTKLMSARTAPQLRILRIPYLLAGALENFLALTDANTGIGLDLGHKWNNLTQILELLAGQDAHLQPEALCIEIGRDGVGFDRLASATWVKTLGIFSLSDSYRNIENFVSVCEEMSGLENLWLTTTPGLGVRAPRAGLPSIWRDQHPDLAYETDPANALSIARRCKKLRYIRLGYQPYRIQRIDGDCQIFPLGVWEDEVTKPDNFRDRFNWLEAI
jgi:hypothetical protein